MNCVILKISPTSFIFVLNQVMPNGVNGNGNGNGNGLTRPQAKRVKKGQNLSYGDAPARLRKLLDVPRSENLEIFKHGTGYIDWMIDPDAQNAMRVPDDLAAASAVFKTRTILALPYASQWDSSGSSSTVMSDPPTNGDTTVIAAPGTTGAYYVTAGGGPTILIDEKSDEQVMYPCLVSASSTVEEFISHGLRVSDKAVIPRRNDLGVPIYEVHIYNVPGEGESPSLTMQLSPASGQGGATDVALLHSSQDAVAPRTFASQTLPWGGGTDFFDFNIPDQTYAFYVEVVSENKTTWTMSIGLQTSSEDVIEGQALSCQLYTVLNPKDLDALDKTSQERTTALSVLCSYAGTDFANGGLITAARLPMGMSLELAERGDYFSFIASLPLYSDDFPLKKGVYCYWMPDSITEFFFSPYKHPKSNRLDEVSLLVINMTRDDPTQEVRAQFVVGIEALSRSNLYNAQVGPVNPLFSKILQFGKLIPAVTENQVHKRILGGLFNKAKTFVTKPQNWLNFGKGLLNTVMR